MVTNPRNSELEAQKERQEEQRAANIGKGVLSTLGRPAAFHQVYVRRLWEDHYRVNVFLGSDVTSAKIAHSYFLVADASGHVVQSTPRITKHY